MQRLKYSLLIILVVLGLMLGLSHLQKQGTISEQTFQMLAIAIAVVVVVINGILRRKGQTLTLAGRPGMAGHALSAKAFVPARRAPGGSRL
ncbi:hypothetical protein PPS11_27231 [Pseudomonas putida S11]|nr:hypothetical protein PPS11_27231 [Pseudomonas putida S11]